MPIETMKSNFKEIVGFLKASEIFPELQYSFETFKKLVSGLSRTDLILWCSRLNLIISSSSDVDDKIREKIKQPVTLHLNEGYFYSELPHAYKQLYYLGQVLTGKEFERISGHIERNGRAVIFCRAQLLELLRWALLLCRDLPGDGNTFEDREVRRRFLCVTLLASEVWERRVFKNYPISENEIDVKLRKSLGMIYKGFEATASAPNLYRTFGRGWSINKEYIPKYYRNFESDFEKRTGISIDDYYNCLSAFAADFNDPTRGSGIFNYQEIIKSQKAGKVVEKFLKIESQSIEDIRKILWPNTDETINDLDKAPFYSYRPLRDRPILTTNDYLGIIVDPIFFCEKFYLGPMFHLLEGNKSANTDYFGRAFEDYAGDILERMFPACSSILAKRLSRDIPVPYSGKNKLQIDACLNDGSEIIIFEIKGSLLNEEIILSDDPENALQHIREKYSAKKGFTDDTKTIGIGQLIRIIQLILNKKWLGQQNEFERVKRIFPVLLVYDSNLGAPIFGNFFASEFEDFLEYDVKLDNADYSKGDIRVTPPIIMTIDDLENLEESINDFGLKDMLSDYSKEHQDRLTPLYNFLALSDYSQKMHHNKNLAEKGIKLAEQSMVAFFG